MEVLCEIWDRQISSILLPKIKVMPKITVNHVQWVVYIILHSIAF